MDLRSGSGPRGYFTLADLPALHCHLIRDHLVALDAVGRYLSPRAERIVRKSSPIGIANSAMPSRLLAMHSCSMLCFRLCHRLIAGGYHTSLLAATLAQRAYFGRLLEPQKHQRSALSLAGKALAQPRVHLRRSLGPQEH